MSWKKTKNGYQWGSAKLNKKGRRWILTEGKESVELPKKATFDHAEKALQKIRTDRILRK